MIKNSSGVSQLNGNESLNAILSKLSEGLIATQTFQNTWIEKNEAKSISTTSKLVKPPKPPTWTKEMAFDTFQKQVRRWSNNEKQITEIDKYHDLIEELKKNKDINGLTEYVNDQIVETCSDESYQTVEKVLIVL